MRVSEGFCYPPFCIFFIVVRFIRPLCLLYVLVVLWACSSDSEFNMLMKGKKLV